MTRTRRIDVAIAGGGVVGSACALALAQAGLEVALVEAAHAPRWSPAQPDLRVYATAPDSVRLLDALGTWTGIRDARAQPYRRMRVWDAAGGGELVFDADAMGAPELGWIVEHALIADRLWRALPAAGVEIRQPARVQGCVQDADGVRLALDDGTHVDCRIAIAADGANSTLRTLAGIDVDAHDPSQQGLVAYVETEMPHQDTAWQRFLPEGPLAFLPCADARSSIVWTLPTEAAQRMAELDDATFSDALTRAFDARLGRVRLASARAAFPLRRQLARTLHAGRVLVLGDAAHVVHPLAGQGVNLGLRDVALLQSSVREARARGLPFDAPQRLARWARTRRSDNAASAHAFDAINRFFSNDDPLPMLLRGPLLGAAGYAPPLLRALWRHAAGA